LKDDTAPKKHFAVRYVLGAGLVLIVLAVVAVNLFADCAVLAIANRLVEQGVGVLPKDIVDTITSTLDKTIDISRGIIEGREGIGEEIIKGTEDIGKGITQGLKGLLKPKKEE